MQNLGPSLGSDNMPPWASTKIIHAPRRLNHIIHSLHTEFAHGKLINKPMNMVSTNTKTAQIIWRINNYSKTSQIYAASLKLTNVACLMERSLTTRHHTDPWSPVSCRLRCPKVSDQDFFSLCHVQLKWIDANVTCENLRIFLIIKFCKSQASETLSHSGKSDEPKIRICWPVLPI